MIVDTKVKTGASEIGNQCNNFENDGQLISNARKDPAAFAQLYRRHYEAIFGYCVHRLFERQAAEDVTSTVFLRAVENFGRFRGKHGKDFRNWLYAIASNAVSDHLRRSARRGIIFKTVLEEAGKEHCESNEESPENLLLLKDAMLSLKPKYQTIITLRFFENLKLTEIAEVLGKSPGTVRKQFARALAKLERKLSFARREVQ